MRLRRRLLPILGPCVAAAGISSLALILAGPAWLWTWPHPALFTLLAFASYLLPLSGAMLLTWLSLRVNARRFTVITVGVVSVALSAGVGTLLGVGIQVMLTLIASVR